jgi:major membrane immunogen (membrane-anchored lipoprotein)
MRVRPFAIVAIVVVLGACGSSGSKRGSSTSGSTAAQNTTLGRGVTDTQIKLGVSLINFSCIRQFTDTIRENQEKNYNIYINDVNAHGGVAGRKIVPVFHEFCPIRPQQAITGCTQFTDDDMVFAVVGNIYDTSGDVQACLAKQHKTPVLTYQLSQALMDKASPGMIILPGSNPERLDKVLVAFFKQQNTLAGKKVAVLGGVSNRKSVTTGLIPALKTLNVAMGSTALLDIGTSGDTAAAQSQLDSFIEKWKSEGVNALVVTGAEASAKQFIEKVRMEMPNVLLATDINDTTREQAREEVQAKMHPNPYEGMLTVSGPTRQETVDLANWKYCVNIYKAQTGQEPPSPTATLKFPDGKINDDYGSINDACQMITLIKEIGDRIGKYLNVDNWLNAVNNYGPIRNAGSGPYASLHTGKYDIDDTFRLVTFDSSLLNGTGDWKPLTSLQNVPGS